LEGLRNFGGRGLNTPNPPSVGHWVRGPYNGSRGEALLILDLSNGWRCMASLTPHLLYLWGWTLVYTEYRAALAQSGSGLFETEIFCMWTHRSAVTCFVLRQADALRNWHLRGSTLSTACSSHYHKNAALNGMHTCRRPVILTQVTVIHNKWNTTRLCVRK